MCVERFTFAEEPTVRSVSYLALAAGLILVGALLDFNYQRSTPDGIRAQGTVVDFERRNSRQVYPVFEFKDLVGQRHRVTSSAQQGIFRLSAGDSVPIVYSRTDAERARIDTPWFSHRWMLGAVIVALSLGIGALVRRDPNAS